jgi:SAM-dependent methyltransferase
MLEKIIDYYSQKIIEHGPTPKGVDWNGSESQRLRFGVLSKLIDNSECTLLDYGCGYGAYYDFLKENNLLVNYTGYDLSQEMIDFGSQKFPNLKWLRHLNDDKYDYIVSSGIFNVAFDTDRNIWENHVFDTINTFNRLSKKGFAFNMLTTYSDTEMAKKHLYYAEPEVIFKYCKKNISKKVVLDHSYPLYEFTIMVKK